MKITLEGITKSFGNKEVIKETNLEVESGSFTTLLGSSGCGKTTLLRMISGLETPDAGKIFFDNNLIFSSSDNINIPPEKRGLGFVFQDFALWPHMNVFENVAFGLRARKDTANLKERVMSALSLVKLEEYSERFPSQLSGGQQQRVAFARAIVIDAGCILFDEPLSALDALLREEMRNELRELITKLGITAIFVTHDQGEAMSMSDKIAVLNEGRIEQYDTPKNIYSHPISPFVAHFIGASNWIDSHSMFRPEKAALTPASSTSLTFNTTVEKSIFMGATYQIHLKAGSEKWIIESNESFREGEALPLFVDKSNILNF